MTKDATGQELLTVEAVPEDSGKRLDKVLAVHLPEISRARLQVLIKAGAVTDGHQILTDGSIKVAPGQRFMISVPAAVSMELAGQNLPLDIVFEDQHLVVLNKPAGMVVHPGNGNADGTLVNALIAHCGDSLSGIGGVRRPGIVHRLDKETSGLLVVAKSDRAHTGLSEQFASHGLDGRLQREYLAITWGRPDLPSGSIDAPLGRSAKNRTRMAVVHPNRGRRAVTHYQVEARYGDVGTLLRIKLETGRTHQIRVHLAHIGQPLLGDKVYGGGFAASRSKLSGPAREALDQLDRQALHAAVLGFEHPVNGKKMRFDREPPADMARLMIALENNDRRGS